MAKEAIAIAEKTPLEKALEMQQLLAVSGMVQPQGAIPAGSGAVSGVAGGGGAALSMPEALSPQEPSLFGLSGNQLATLAGGIGAALAPQDTWQARLGTFAQSLGKAKIVADAPKVDIGLKTKKKEPVDNITGLAGIR